MEREPGNEDEDFEVKQRRTLVDQWASFSQAERDEYQNRAPSRGKEDWYPPVLKGNMRRCLKAHGFCNLIVQQPLSPRNRALWAKMRIMMYRLDGEDGTCFGDENKGAGTYVIDPNAAGPSPVKPKDFYSWLWLDPARFDHMAMTSQGTVIFHHWEADMFFADQEALDTGRLLLCHIENNGRVVAEARVCPLFSYHVLCLIEGLGRDLEQIIVNDDAFVLNDAANEV